jgi:protein gp37
MADTTIEWTEKSWNPLRGCSILSKGCTNCFAMKIAHRFSKPGLPFHGLTTMTKGGAVWTGKIALAPDKLEEPLNWRKPRRIFVNSMSDLFHESVDDEYIAAVFCIMAIAHRHTFQVLTKRASRMRQWFETAHKKGVAQFLRHSLVRVSGTDLSHRAEISQGFWPLRNVHLGVSAEDQAAADERIPHLQKTPAAVRWVSAEPLLGPIDLTKIPFLDGDKRHRQNVLTGEALMYGSGVNGHPDIIVRTGSILSRVNWVVSGGESGHGARPMHPIWLRSLRDQCVNSGTPFFFKQWGDWIPGHHYTEELRGIDGALGESRYESADLFEFNGKPQWIFNQHYLDWGDHTMFRCGKQLAGRLLDGREWNEYPK